MAFQLNVEKNYELSIWRKVGNGVKSEEGTL